MNFIFTDNKVHKVQANNKVQKVQKVRTSQLWSQHKQLRSISITRLRLCLTYHR